MLQLKIKKSNNELVRCVFCKKLPRAGMANRSELYRLVTMHISIC